ncbi:hypothetical protein ACFZC3_15480 [Streptomyces sp. NPDC007903]|uniref:hypothetical protein n=1 Tax=Streptomyces sp. NPDC007903 TaxID=3364786 RepID=UPI0036EE935F
MFDEQTFTPHAQQGWQSWDAWSPELDFCRFAGLLQRMLQPRTVLETGVGVGRLTAHLDRNTCRYIGFESDPAWRRSPADPELVTPAVEHMAGADLVILDSAVSVRHAEIALWAEHGRSGSVCLVHDCGNGHGPDTIHAALAQACLATGQPGTLLRNPRGGWMGVHA